MYTVRRMCPFLYMEAKFVLLEKMLKWLTLARRNFSEEQPGTPFFCPQN